MCLTYAYALYDLGRALRLSGDPAAAVPILEPGYRSTTSARSSWPNLSSPARPPREEPGSAPPA